MVHEKQLLAFESCPFVTRTHAHTVKIVMCVCKDTGIWYLCSTYPIHPGLRGRVGGTVDGRIAWRIASDRTLNTQR